MAAKHEKTERVRKLRPIFYQIGLLTALLLTFGAFRWTIEGETAFIPDEGFIDTNSYTMGEIRLIEENTEVVKKEKIEQPKPDPDRFKIDKTNKTDDTKKDEEQKQTTTSSDWDALMKQRPNIVVPPEEFNVEPIWVPSQLPQFPGGEDALKAFIAKNYITPSIVTETARGSITIYAQYIVEKDGSISNIVILKDGGYPEAGEAFVKTLSRMPRWSPGYQGAHAVRVYMAIPLKIKLK